MATKSRESSPPSPRRAEFQSISGQLETTEPTTNGAPNAAATARTAQNMSQPPSSSSSASTTTAAPARKQSASNLAAAVTSPSSGVSPRTSRNASPTRKDKPQPLTSGLSTQPSAAAIQRALSASNVPHLQQTGSITDAVSRLPRGQKNGSTSGENTPQWPLSPRLKSPPPTGNTSRRGSSTLQQKKAETNAVPGITVQSATPQDRSILSPGSKNGSSGAETTTQKSDQQPIPPSQPKGPTRNPTTGKSVLETVQENSADSLTEPSPAAIQAAADLKPLTKIEDDESRRKQDGEKTDDDENDDEQPTAPTESGSESAGTKSDTGHNRRTRADFTGTHAHRSLTANAKTTSTSSPAPPTARTRQQSEAKLNMTVETETVQSIPHSALATSDRYDNGGSVRAKPSSETIRARKDRKKVERKARSINQGTVTSKSDLFEARVASAVDEANTSESDETFVYESNPPEPQRRQRHHSRTPSVTSAHSTVDGQRGSMRNIADAFDGSKRISGKRSMKFSSHTSNGPDSPEAKDAATRSHTPRHIGRYGRSNTRQSTNQEQDSPFTQASKQRHNQPRSQGHSRTASPKSLEGHPRRLNGLFGKKHEQSFDFDAEGADDERTPLMNSVRTPRPSRNMHLRRLNTNAPPSAREYFESPERPRHCCSGRTGACILTSCFVVVLVVFIVGFCVAGNRPLNDVEIRAIQNVLASEQELMLDLVVGAVNPNPLGITVSEMDVNLFAKSKHVGTGHGTVNHPRTLERAARQQRKAEASAEIDVDYTPNPSPDPSGNWFWPLPGHNGDHDHGTDPDPDFGQDAQTMLLGRIFQFDQPLYFQASLIRQQRHLSQGGLRLAKPGNQTETGGSARWERTIHYPFELIVRGVLRYQLPVSGRQQTATISGAVMVHPEEGIDGQGNMRVEPVDRSEQWQWIEWGDLEDD